MLERLLLSDEKKLKVVGKTEDVRQALRRAAADGGGAGPAGEDHPVLRPATDRVYADGWRMQLPGWWPHRPDEPHDCHQQGHWTRDGRLVLSCCGLDAT